MALPASVTTNLFSDFKNSFTGPFGDVDQTVQDTDNTSFSFGSVLNEKVAQSFQATGGDLVSIEVRLRKSGSPSDSVSLALYSNSGGLPGSLLATAASQVNAALITATAKPFRFNFFIPYTVLASTTYWFVVSRTGSLGTTDYIISTHSGNPYANGQFAVFSTAGEVSLWSVGAGTEDARFKVNIRTATRYLPCVDKTNNKVRMFKSVDLGQTWSEQNSANAPTITSTANVKTISASQQDNFIAVMLPETTTFYKMFRFDTSGDTWETSSFASSSSVVVNANVSGAAPLPSAYRPFAASNTYCAAFNGATETVMGSPRRRIKVKRTGTSTPGYDLVGSPNTADLTTIPSAAVDYDLRAALLDGNGIWHCFWTQTDDSNLRHRSFDPDATTFTTLNNVGSTPAVTSNSAAYPVGLPTNYYRNGEWYIAIPYVDSGVLKVARCLASGAATAGDWTITNVITATIETTNSNPAVLVADNEQGGKLFLIYTKTDGKLYYTHDQANDSWVAEQELHPGTKTVGAISGGVMVDSIGLCYLDTAPATDDLKFDSL